MICRTWIASASDLLRRVRVTANMMVGVPDYDVYVAHRHAHHPQEPVLTREEFVRNRTNSRYGVETGKMTRCC